MDSSNMLDPRPRTHNALNDFYQSHFREAVKNGDQIPYVWPYRNLGVYVLLAYLLLVPTGSRFARYAYYPVFAFFAYWSWKAMLETKSASLAVSYLIGIGNSWAVLWLASRTLFNDHRTARRIERRTASTGETSTTSQHQVDNSTSREQDNLRHRRANHIPKTEDSSVAASDSYYWQTLPAGFVERLDFIVDLLCSMRGPGWMHQARTIPSPPDEIASKLSPPPPSTKSVVREYKDRRSVVLANVIRGFKFSVYMDIIKTMMSHDPYFLGFVQPTPPGPNFLPSLIRNSPVLTKWYRLILGMIATRTALGMIFCLSPILCSGLFGPRIFGLRAESWYYSDFGGDWRYLLSHGISGWWGAWWHQIFRVGLDAPPAWVCKKLGISQRQPLGKAITLLLSFGCSGVLHVFGSICMIPDTKPWSGPFRFFMLQPLGIAIENLSSYVLKTIGITQKIPSAIRKIVTVIWLAAWIYYTGPMVVDDFSRGGIWLFEPVPISIVKILGFGEANDDWWRWRARNVFWYTGDRWWKSGITC